MAERYIQRFRLTPRQYTAAAPVVLAAGALLKDTQNPRLVAQLKFKSISPELLTALRVQVACLDETGAVQNTVEFCYAGLQVQRGNTFGTYTAIPLPLSGSTRCTVSLLSAAFSGGRTWEAPQGTKAVLLPAFTPLEEAVADPAQCAQAQGRIPKCRYAYREVEDLWYCPCGGVNRSGETNCHRCRGSRSQAARYADPARLEAEARLAQEEEAKQVQLREAARLEAEQKKAAQQAAKAEKARLKAERSQAGAGAGRWKKLLPALLVVLVLGGAAGLLLPRLMGNGSQTAAGDSVGGLLPNFGDSNQDVHVTTPSDQTTVPFDMQADENGACEVTAELVQDFFPSAECINFDGVPNMGNEIEPYLLNSYQMAALISSHGERGSQNESGSFNPEEDPNSLQCLLIYDENTHLMGYGIGVPEEVSDGVWRLEVTLCDYDFTDLFEEQMEAFSSSQQDTFSHYISPSELDSCGAEWILVGYNTGRSPNLEEDDAQRYHLWSQLNSPWVEKLCRSFDRLQDRLPRADRWRCFLLLDEDYHLLGYTYLNSKGEAGTEGTSASTTLTATGSVELYLEENSRGQCVFDQDQLRGLVPQMEFFNLAGFACDLGDDPIAYLTDSLHMAWLVASQGIERGGHSSATYTLDSNGIFVLLLYQDPTTLCGYFVGRPEHVSEHQWRMRLTLCSYDFSAIYQQQAQGYPASSQFTQLSEQEITSCGAAWYVEPTGQISGPSLSESVMLQSIWSRATSPYLSQFCRPMTDFPNAARHASEEHPFYYLLLDESMEPIGYVRVTDGEAAREMDFWA